MKRPREMSTDGVAREIGALVAKGWKVESIDGYDFTLIAPSGTATTIRGIHLPYLDDNSVDFEMLTDERQEEEIKLARLCELVVRYRCATNRVFTNEMLSTL